MGMFILMRGGWGWKYYKNKSPGARGDESDLNGENMPGAGGKSLGARFSKRKRSSPDPC